MLFPTIDFFVFFLFVYAVSWGINRRNSEKKLFLVAASYFFYAQWDWRFIFLLAASSVANFLFAHLVTAAHSDRVKSGFTAAAVVFNLSLLCWFKYFDFLSAQLHNLTRLAGYSVDFGGANVALPVAISFLTFHGISYVVDIRRGKVAAAPSLTDVMLYMAFFPHLVAGPIVRAADFLEQLSKPSDPKSVDFGSSLVLILGGLAKKVIIAGHLSILLVDPVFSNPSDAPQIDLWMAMIGYAVVIYCDFSAYTDIARGVANLLGYRFPANFNQPYRALSLKDFWRRWHITLSSWLRDYLYFPLGGSKLGTIKTYRNLLVVMFLGGLWHGAGYTFIIWGLLHGFGLCIERAFGFDEPSPTDPVVVRIIRWMWTFSFVLVAWVFFRSADLDSAIEYFHALGAGTEGPTHLSAFVVILMGAGLLLHFIPAEPVDAIRNWLERIGPLGQASLAGIGLTMISIMSPAGIAPFIYFQF